MTSLAALVATSGRVAATSSRTAKVRELAELLRGLGTDEIATAVLYLTGDTPQGRFGIGYALLQEAAGQGAATEPELQVADVDRRLEEIAAIRGTGSTQRRAEALRNLFTRATVEEQGFLLRLLVGELRQGALGGVMLDAIAAASSVPIARVRRAAMYAKDVGSVATAALTQGADALDAFQLQPLAPIAPMLAQTAEDVSAALEELEGEIAFEWKMDGARIQLHRFNGEVRVFTRSGNDVTHAIPEIVQAALLLPSDDTVLDGEAIAFTPEGRPHAFQITMRRFGRKLDVEHLRAELPMRAFYFDCLRLNGESLADRPTRERYDALVRAVPPETARIPRLVTASVEEAQAFYDAAITAGHEGLMAKSLDAPYEAGNRGASWRKIKRAHTLDLVVLAAEWGHGRRQGKLSNLHLGAVDPDTNEYVMLGKTFKGLTDAMLEWQTQEFLARETRREPGVVYVRPEIVVEIAFSDLQASPRYPGGLALRLARVKAYRPDKTAAQADTMEEIRRIFAAQQ